MGSLQGPFQGAVIFLPRVAIDPKLLPWKKPPGLARLDGFLETMPMLRPLRIRLLQGGLLLRAGIHRAHPSDDLPQVVGGLEDSTKGRHRSNHDLLLDTLVTLLLQLVGTERDQPEQDVVVGPMPPFGGIFKTSDDLWKVITYIRSVSPGSEKKPPLQ